MRIGIDGLPLASVKTGIGHYTCELARALARFAPQHEFELLSFLPPSAETDGELPANLHQVQAKKRRFWWGVGLPLHLRHSPVSLFHGTNYEIPLWSGCPTVVNIHDLSLLLYPETHLSHTVRRGRQRLPLVARRASMIITATQFAKREVCEHLKVAPEKVMVTPYAQRSTFRPLAKAETEEVRRRLGIEDVFLLFVGTIEPRKNLVTLVRAFGELLRNSSLRSQLVIAGPEGWRTSDLFAEIEKAGLDDRLKFTGYLSDYDLCALYSSCTAFVFPSLYEGFGLPLLEAMACGAPVITSNIPTIVEVTGDAAHLISAKDVDELARAIVAVVSDSGMREHLSRAGLARAAQFTWERTAQLTFDVYAETLKRASKNK